MDIETTNVGTTAGAFPVNLNLTLNDLFRAVDGLTLGDPPPVGALAAFPCGCEGCRRCGCEGCRRCGCEGCRRCGCEGCRGCRGCRGCH
jgi:hypothetical protein